MNEPEKVYAVDDVFGFSKYEVESAIVEKRTAKQVTLQKGSGTPFGYRRLVPIADDCLAATPAEAYRRAIARRAAALDRAMADVATEQKAIRLLEEKLAELIKSDQPK